MAYALNLTTTATRDRALAAERPSLWQRLARAVEAAQMARVRRELRLYAPHLEASLEMGDLRKVRLSEDGKLPFVG